MISIENNKTEWWDLLMLGMIAFLNTFAISAKYMLVLNIL